MFAAPGTLYVFRIHQVVCANLVTRPGEAVLLRAGSLPDEPARFASGPGRLCRALGIVLEDDGEDAVEGSRVGVWARTGPRPRIVAGPRVGIRKAADRPLRFSIAGDPAVSRARPYRRSFAQS